MPRSRSGIAPSWSASLSSSAARRKGAVSWQLPIMWPASTAFTVPCRPSPHDGSARRPFVCHRGCSITPRFPNRSQEILQRFTPIIEPLSLDEAFLEVRGSQALFGSAAVIGRRIKAEIRQELHLVASVGVLR